MALISGLTSCSTPNTRAVDDQASILTLQQRDAISAVVEGHNKNGPGKLILRTIKELPPDTTIEKYAYSLALEDRKARYERNDDVYVVIALRDRRMRIEVSPSMQALLPESFCQHVIGDVMIPNFRHEDYYEGIQAGIKALVERLEGRGAEASLRADRPLASRAFGA
jgi:uncharacterized protein